MTAKTPEQIAEQIYAEYDNHRDNIILTSAGYKLDLIRAIEADRAQREKLPEAITDGIGADYQHGEALVFHPQGGQMDEWTDVVAYDEESDTVTRYAYSHTDDTLRALRYTR